MTVVAIVQARMTSTRLPGKVLMDLAGSPLLAQELRRLRRACAVDDIVVATTTNSTDDPIAEVARAEGVSVFRGSEDDVLGRYVCAAAHAKADLIVRITADCPLIDPKVVDRVVHALGRSNDYASNVLERTFPRGLDCEVLHRDTLERLGRLATSALSREHVTWLINEERPDLFVRQSVADDQDNSDLSWTVDEAVDLELVRRLYARLDLGIRPLPYREVVDHVRSEPELASP